MRIVIAPDSFKGCLSAAEAARALAEGWQRARPGDDMVLVPMADGGEGTVDALVAATRGAYRSRPVRGPLGRVVEAKYGLISEVRAAVIEMAAAAGLPLLAEHERNPLLASTFGVGELVCDALAQGVERLLLGLGGSATNDAGAGMAQALGYRLLDADGKDLPPGGAALARLHCIENADRLPALAGCIVEAACDVDNPLCGPAGASYVYGPQKGATPEDVRVLDAALAHFAEVVARDLGIAIENVPGAGAAGGMGGGVLAFLRGVLRPGVELVAEASNLPEALRGANLVITGEGRVDGQTAHGKTPVGVARYAVQQGVPVLAVAGSLGADYAAVLESGIDAVLPILPGPGTLGDALRDAADNLARTTEQVARLWNCAQGKRA
jgi:glycerate kinase